MGSVGVSVNSSQDPPLKAQPPDRCRGYHAERNINFQLHLPPPSPQTKKHKQILFLWPAHTNPFLCLDFSSSSQFAASTKKHPIVSENMKQKFKATSLCFAVVHVWIPARHCAVILVRRQSLKLAGGGRRSFPLRQRDTAQTCTVSLLACLNCKVINSYCFTACWKWIQPNL